MSNVVFQMQAFSNITYDRTVETGITVEEWATMSNEEQLQAMTDALWEDIDVSPLDEETGEYL